ncbi:MAG: exodeoxyribonuclease beta subunit [Nocardioidaceae bacterium]|nr:exodeoxyribonuclease beta subunit [Nocardioidaceae bacterium]
MTSAPAGFDICGPLPRGTTRLEASAGTGKTFTIAALATRYVAEGVAGLDSMMLVTFGRAATQELRERVRTRLVATEQGLADPAYARRHGDRLLRLLAEAPDAEVALRRKRLVTALANFDASTIATTHGFCQQMLTGLGVAGDFDPASTFVESVDDIVVEVVDDLYLRKWGRPDASPPSMPYKDALSAVRTGVTDRHARLEPSAADPGSTPGQYYALAVAARAEVDRRKRQRRLRDYDDLLTGLRDALADPERGPLAQERVRSRYSVVLVDEFQDTDPVQWEILRLAFHGHTTLIVIGDPKQAIYAFRGGDVVTYLGASDEAESLDTLGVNWRSDEGLLAAFGAVFRGAALGDPGIVVRAVESAHPGRRLSGAPGEAPFRLRVVTRSQLGVGPRRKPIVGPVRELVADDLAADVVRLLGSGAHLVTSGPPRCIAPGDIAVLVNTNKQAQLVREALSRVHVPAVLTGTASVFSTDMATQWLLLLQGLDRPSQSSRVRTAALTCFVGWDAERLAAAGDGALDTLGPLLRGWADVLHQRGIPALVEVVTEEAALYERLLATPTGERRLTDLRQLAQLLHAAAVDEQLGTVALVEWLQRRINDAADDNSEERSRRLDSDAEAVQVVTVHRSKGLEFPVVYVPFGWDRHTSSADYPRYHAGLVRSLDVGGKEGADFDEHCRLNAEENSGEDLRLLYVAVTRAQCQVVTWWAPSTTTAASPLNRLLFGGFSPGDQPEPSVALLSDEDARRQLDTLALGSGGTIAVESAVGADGGSWQPRQPAATALAVAAFTRGLDTAWRRTSYTAMTAAAHESSMSAAGVRSEPEERQLDDEADGPAGQSPGSAATGGTAADDEAMKAVLSPMRDLPSGAAFGTVVHSILEAVDTAAPELASELVERSRVVLDRGFGTALDPEALGAALLPAMETPLGPLADGVRLRDVPPGDRLAELDFELPLAGGDRPAAVSVTLGAFAEVLRRRLAPEDPFAPYPDRLTGGSFRRERLRGYLVGSLDAVLRLPADGDDSRYLVVDYKTNWLGGPSGYDGPLTAWHYRPKVLGEAMIAADYPLQLLLYLVALHRFLRWRRPDYDPDRHLGGGLYLFLRGMCGPATPQPGGAPCGVFGWVPPHGLVGDLSDVLAGGT